MTTAQLGGVMGQTGHRYGPTSSAAFEAGAWPIRRWIQNAPVFESGHDQWIDSVLHRIKEAFLLNDDWDHEGAVAVSQGAVSNARDLAVALHASKSRRPFVSATPLGGIGFEWSGFDVEMFIDVYSQRFEVTVRRSDTGAYEESEIPELGPEFVSAIASFIR